MIVINNFSDTRFTLNGIQYFKNFISEVAGDQLKIYNAYDKKDVRSDYKHFSQYSVNGTVYGSVSALQSALLPVIYTRSSLGGGFEQNNTWREVFLGFYSNPTERNALFNQTLIVDDTENVMLVFGYQNPELLVTEPPTIYRYKWANGEGTFNPIPKVEGEDIIFESVTQVNGGDIITIINGANTQTFDLGDIGTGTIVDFINDNGPYDLTDTYLVYYFIYESDGITYLYQFIGTNGTYGDGETPITESDLKFITSSGVEPSPLQGQSTILIEATLSDLGVSTFDEVTPAKLAEYTATLDIEVGLNQDIDYKIEEGFTFDLLVDEAELFTNLGINDEATFTSWVEANISLTPTITDFSLADGRIRCNLSFPYVGGDINITDFGITKINGLRCFSEVNETLVFVNSPLTQITGVNNLINLIAFGIINSNLTKIENINNLINLTQLSFENNQITKLEGIDTFVNLIELYLQNNEISEIQTGVFDSLLSLSLINLEDNNLTTAEFNKLNTWAVNAVSGGTITTTGNTDNFNTSTTYTTLLGKGWTINL